MNNNKTTTTTTTPCQNTEIDQMDEDDLEELRRDY
jgi:hypothetical protein